MIRRPLHSLPAAITVAGLLAGIVLIASHNVVWPHDAVPTVAKPQGWAYPFACCANFDCKSVQSSEVIEGARGYEIRSTGELIPMSDKRVKISPDGETHICAHQAGLDAGKVICLFVPDKGY